MSTTDDGKEAVSGDETGTRVPECAPPTAVTLVFPRPADGLLQARAAAPGGTRKGAAAAAGKRRGELGDLTACELRSPRPGVAGSSPPGALREDSPRTESDGRPLLAVSTLACAPRCLNNAVSRDGSPVCTRPVASDSPFL